MNPPPETAACPRCGASLPEVSGLCPGCLAKGGSEGEESWLLGSTAEGGDEWSVPGWRLVGTLGAGGMGRVYQAEREEDGQASAIKVLDERWLANPAMVARFAAEAARLEKLDHPNILKLLGTTETEDGRLCLITELVHGCDLARLLRAEKLSPDRAMAIFRAVCSAVAHAHAAGILHRDIKPSNILVGRGDIVKLADFGLAAEWGGDPSLVSAHGLTMTTDQFGSAYYMAPERLLNTRRSGPETDVFALGVLFYHLMAGQLPLGKFAPLSQLTDLPREIDGVISNALESNPDSRTPTVAALEEGVERVWRDHLAGRKRGQRWRRAAWLSAAAALVLAAAGGGAWWQYQRSRPQPIVFADPALATREKPWTNSLGMNFVPVPGTRVLFSTWETRRRDMQMLLMNYKDLYNNTWIRTSRDKWNRRTAKTMLSLDGSGHVAQWDEPGFPITPDHAAIHVNAVDTRVFCRWLTWKERFEGRLKDGQRYRLPTDAEWLAACGGADQPLRPGNLAGPEARDAQWPAGRPADAPGDPFPRTAPVGSFPPEAFGLHDMSGNVAEWVQLAGRPMFEDAPAMNTVLIGPSYLDGDPATLRYDHRREAPPPMRRPFAGFRLALEFAQEPKESEDLEN